MPSLGRLVRRRTLSARLIAGVLLLLAGATAVIGVVTYFAVRNSMENALDGQLQSSSITYTHCLDGALQGSGNPSGRSSDNDQSMPCNQGQPQGMLGVQITNGKVAQCEVVAGMSQNQCTVSAGDQKTLMALHATKLKPLPGGGGHYPPPPRSTCYTLNLHTLRADYRVTAVSEPDGDLLVTGLPMSDVEHTLGQVALAELIVFLSVLLLAGVVGTVLIRMSLRPLRRVAATATQVAELPLESGEVSLPAGVPDTDPRTEVGQVGTAFNRMLGHVERALSRRAASEARLRRFAADASHELRTPLSAIRGYAEFALRHPGPVPDEVTHALGRVQSESARMTVLVDDLLLLARLDAGRPLDQEPVDLSRLAIDVTSDTRVARRDHRWQLDLPDDPVLVEGDENRLHQVLANLLSNAGKHTPAGSTVTVAVAVKGTQAELSVTDDGPGIPAELIPDLFERFTRADTSRARNADDAGHSTGLGLAIVDAVVAAHGGSVTVTSEPGKTRFTVVLPVLRETGLRGDGDVVMRKSSS
jgi:two-component system OmpR family sensor kinase